MTQKPTDNDLETANNGSKAADNDSKAADNDPKAADNDSKTAAFRLISADRDISMHLSSGPSR